LDDAKSAVADGISWLKPETEQEHGIYRQVLMFHQERGNEDAIRRMRLEHRACQRGRLVLVPGNVRFL
jgi:hypothetical protein